MKKIVVASDSFKGSLSSMQVARSVERAVALLYPDCQVICVSVADGGEGTMEAVVFALEGQIISAESHDPLGRCIVAQYGMAGSTAIIEMAAASGLPLLSAEERNPWIASSFGTGELIMHAIDHGCNHVCITLGGTATNDAAMGILHAMGYRFYDRQGSTIDSCSGCAMGEIVYIDESAVSDIVRQAKFTIACDVDTPFCGPRGAASVFAPQKGADADMVLRLDEGMKSLATVIERQYGVDLFSMPGAGAAGGAGGVLSAVLQTPLKRGVGMVLDAIDFDAIIRDADLVITGEGRLDAQTAMGKTAAGVLERAKRQHIPVIAIGGCVDECDELLHMGFAGIFPIADKTLPMEVAMQAEVAMENITQTVKRVLQSFPS